MIGTHDSPLTAIREAVINSIDFWEPLKDTFRTKLYMNRPEGERMLPPPDERDVPSGVADLPCIRVRPATGLHRWETNQHAVIPYTMEITLWFPWTKLDAIERAYLEIIYSMFQSKAPGDKDTFLGRIGCNKAVIETLRVAYPRMGQNADGPKTIQFQFGVTVPKAIQPQG